MSRETFIVDRIEENFAVCEKQDGNMIDIKLTQIEGKIIDGDVLIKSDGFYKVDKELTDKRKEEIRNLVEGMWE